MNKKFYVFAASAAIIFTNYSNNANAFANFNSIQDTTKAPVEKLAPNNSYSPAFAGQTRIAGTKTKTALDVKVLAEGLKRPWGITVLPDGRLLITEKTGTLLSGNFTASLVGGTLTTINGDFNNIPQK